MRKTLLYQIHGLPETKTPIQWAKLAVQALRIWKQRGNSITGRIACVNYCYFTTASRYIKTKRNEFGWICKNMAYPQELAGYMNTTNKQFN